MYLDNLVAFYDMSTVDPVNLAPRTYGLLNGTGTSIVAADLVNGIGGGIGTQYDGANDYTTFAHNAVANMGTSQDFSMAIWTKPLALGTMMLMGKKVNQTSTGDPGYSLYYTGGNVAILIADGTNRSYLGTGYGAVVGKWIFTVGVCDRTNGEFRLFENENLIASGAGSSPYTSGVGDLSNTEDVSVAAESDGGNKFNCIADFGMIFDCALTQTQVIDLYHRTRTGRM